MNHREEVSLAGVSIIIPAYNEEEGIAAMLDELTEAMAESHSVYEVIVVDDGSTDRTAQLVRGKGVMLLQHPLNRGYGAALKTGIHHARYDTVVMTDADGTYPSKAIPMLVHDVGEYDMIVGARTGENVCIPVVRRLAKWFLTKLANYMAGVQIPDLNSGLRVMRRAAVLRFLGMLPSGFSFTSTITLAMLTNDYNVKYVPIDYRRRVGKSKFRPIQDTGNFLSLVIRTILFFNPLRVFLPIGLLLLTLGVLKIFYDGIMYNFSIRGSTIVILMTAFQVLVLGLVADLIVAQRRVG